MDAVFLLHRRARYVLFEIAVVDELFPRLESARIRVRYAVHDARASHSRRDRIVRDDVVPLPRTSDRLPERGEHGIVLQSDGRIKTLFKLPAQRLVVPIQEIRFRRAKNMRAAFVQHPSYPADDCGRCTCPANGGVSTEQFACKAQKCIYPLLEAGGRGYRLYFIKRAPVAREGDAHLRASEIE